MLANSRYLFCIHITISIVKLWLRFFRVRDFIITFSMSTHFGQDSPLWLTFYSFISSGNPRENSAHIHCYIPLNILEALAIMYPCTHWDIKRLWFALTSCQWQPFSSSLQCCDLLTKQVDIIKECSVMFEESCQNQNMHIAVVFNHHYNHYVPYR